MVPPSVLALPDGADTRARVLELVQADPVAIIDIAAEIAEERGAWPVDAVTQAAHDESASILEADRVRVRDAIGRMLMGRDVDQALEWLQQVGVLPRLFPELSATVDLVQESGRQHKDVWAHTKQVVRQAVRRPDVRWAALLHDIGKVPTRTYTPNGVHFHGHAEVGARMFDKISQRIPFDRDQRRAVRFLIKHHLRSNQYSDTWTDSAVRRFHREMAPHLRDLMDLSRADITSKRPGRRRSLLEQIAGLAHRIEVLAEADAKLPPLPTGVGTAIMEAFRLPPSKLIGDLKKALEAAVERGEVEARREDAYYVAHLARSGMVPGLDPDDAARLIAAGGLTDEAAAEADAAEARGDYDEPFEREDDGHDGDPERPRDGVLDCGADPEADACLPAAAAAD
ncbi:MAG: HD domain-containing protein, partial [Myxococcales bacterium]|nr:HD domain-containing protein [Myxococcales bacterium]